MKKFLAALVTLFLACTAFACAEDAVSVFVSISDDTGALVLALEPVSVTDADGDGALTINDALILAHAAFHENGAEGYASAATEFGQSMTRLWGVENGGSYGYYVNNASAWSLLDPVAENDHIKVFVYTDLEAWSDTYAYFGSDIALVAPDQAFGMVLYAAGYDEAWNPVAIPVANAEIYVNGEATGVLTDAEGLSYFTISEPGLYTFTAVSEEINLVTPVCSVVVSEQ